eukprot:517225-Pyramimonas_sp.AAC.1
MAVFDAGSCKKGRAARMCLRHVLLAVRHAHAVRLVVCTHTSHMSRSLHVYADDITVSIICSLRSIVTSASRVLRILARLLTQLGLPPARNNLSISSSIPGVARRVAARQHKFGYAYRSALEVIGIEVASGRPLRYRRLRERVSVASKRVPRLSQVRKAGPIVC